jgi:hypothetical protein
MVGRRLGSSFITDIGCVCREGTVPDKAEDREAATDITARMLRSLPTTEALLRFANEGNDEALSVFATGLAHHKEHGPAALATLVEIISRSREKDPQWRAHRLLDTDTIPFGKLSTTDVDREVLEYLKALLNSDVKAAQKVHCSWERKCSDYGCRYPMIQRISLCIRTMAVFAVQTVYGGAPRSPTPGGTGMYL